MRQALWGSVAGIITVMCLDVHGGYLWDGVHEVVFERSGTLPEEVLRPVEDRVWAEISHDEATVQVPAFYDGGRRWAVRWRPRTAGAYRVQLVRRSGASRTPLVTEPAQHEVQVDVAARAGFVQCDPSRLQRFRLSTGEAFFPLGVNANLETWSPWYRPDEATFTRYFDAMQAAGMNTARIAAKVSSGRGVLDPPPRRRGTGGLDIDAARRWDAIVRLASERGIRLQVCIEPNTDASRNYAMMSNGRFDERAEAIWQASPWNRHNGGFLKSADECFAHPRAREYFEAKVRYFVARWGAFSAIMAWDLASEPHLWGVSRRDPDALHAWLNELTAYVKGIDAYGHLVTTGLMHDGVLGSNDYYQPHCYPSRRAMARGRIRNGLAPRRGDATFGFAGTFDHAGLKPIPRRGGKAWAMDKPVFYGEMGMNLEFKRVHGGPIDSGGGARGAYFEARANVERRMFWESLFSGGAGSGLIWDSTGWLLKYDMFTKLAPATRFARLIRLAERPFEPVRCETSDKDVFSLAMGTEEAVAAFLFAVGPGEPAIESQTVLTVDVVSDGAYRVVWMDTLSGHAEASSEQWTAEGGVLRIMVPPGAGERACYAELSDG